MASYVPPTKNGASGWIGYVQLSPRTPTGQFQANPTLATGDVKVSIDGAALANLGTLPVVTPASSTWVKVTLAQAEINGDNILVQFIDAAGAEWCDTGFTLQTAAQTIDGLNTLIDALPTNAELATALGTADDAVLAQVALVKSQTDLIPSDPADASVIAARFDTLDTSIADLPTNTELATALGTADDAVLAQVALVKAKTDLIPADPADASDIAATLATIAGFIDTEITTLQTSVNDLPTNAELATALAAADDAVLSAINDLPTNAELATALGTADDAVLTQVAAIKLKTDSLTFTVPGKVDSNLEYVNGAEIDGDGSDVNPWGPV